MEHPLEEPRAYYNVMGVLPVQNLILAGKEIYNKDTYLYKINILTT